mmetsp:Transcript_7704/g.19129  ORF Transcript_7704/g.19129 Transcript_7704/m.19129 type:complete len:212 (+) Transcript_7704:641-1276(+)
MVRLESGLSAPLPKRREGVTSCRGCRCASRSRPSSSSSSQARIVTVIRAGNVPFPFPSHGAHQGLLAVGVVVAISGACRTGVGGGAPVHAPKRRRGQRCLGCGVARCGISCCRCSHSSRSGASRCISCCRCSFASRRGARCGISCCRCSHTSRCGASRGASCRGRTGCGAARGGRGGAGCHIEKATIFFLEIQGIRAIQAANGARARARQI